MLIAGLNYAISCTYMQSALSTVNTYTKSKSNPAIFKIVVLLPDTPFRFCSITAWNTEISELSPWDATVDAGC